MPHQLQPISCKELVVRSLLPLVTLGLLLSTVAFGAVGFAVGAAAWWCVYVKIT